MNHPNNWYRPLLGAALLSALAISGCAGTSGVSGGLNGFSNNNNGNNNGNGGNGGNGGGGNSAGVPPFLEVVNAASIAEFSINQTTGGLTPVNFNTVGQNGVQNTIQLANTPGPITSPPVVFTGLNTSDTFSNLYVGTNQDIEVFTVNRVTGLIAPLLVNGQPFTVAALGATVTSLDTAVVTSTNATTKVTTTGVFLYAALQNNQIQVFTINNDGSATPLLFNNNTNSIATGVQQPIELVDSSTRSGGTLPFLYCLNQASGTGSIAAFTITDGVTQAGSTQGGLQPLLVNGTNTIAANGLSVPTSMAEFTAPVPGLIVTNQNDALSAFAIQTSNLNGAVVGSLVASGFSNGTNVSTPTSVTAVGPLAFVTSQQGGTGNVATFEIQNNNNNIANLTIVATNGGQNSTTTGVNLPAASTVFNNGLNNFFYAANTQGTGTGSIGEFDLNATFQPQAILVTNGTNTQNTGILSPVANPQDMTIVP